MINTEELDKIIVGRVLPHIYAFSTNTIPNYLKVGDTYRPVDRRLNEWRHYYPQLDKLYDKAAVIDKVFFRDFAVHDFLKDKHARLEPNDLPMGVFYSREFFQGATPGDVDAAFADIEADYHNGTQKYKFYDIDNRLPENISYVRNQAFEPRPNQQATIDNFKMAISNGRTNLLMYAVMRFGKSFTAMCCAAEMSAKLVVITSAKADVLQEWKKTVESHMRFADYDFICSNDLSYQNDLISEKLKSGRRVVVFLTLQDLQGEDIKKKHFDLLKHNIDLLLIDETHFGVRTKKYGEVLRSRGVPKDIDDEISSEEKETLESYNQVIEKSLHAKIRIHLSGTPYKILMGSEFAKEDIIAFYQFTDIIDDQEKWNNEYGFNDEYAEWDNPYYGFPQMIRFAFNPNKSSMKKLDELKAAGVTYAFSALFQPKSIRKQLDGSHKQFIHEQEILDLLHVIDGSKDDNNLLGFLNYDKIKQGLLCRHIVIVLPYCASCDALQTLIETHRESFTNLKDYEIINISGVDAKKKNKTPKDIKDKISECETSDIKTITLTVNRMLTGSTVPEWDTMLYLKDTASAQEYDQAIFRLQNQYIKNYIDKDGNLIKYNMKPQTLLVDFNPQRMFVMQELKAQIYNVNTDKSGNTKARERLEKELKVSPIVTLNKDKIVEVSAADILKAISDYHNDRGIKDEALEIPVDLDILKFGKVFDVIKQENEIGSKAGLSTPAHKDKDNNGGDELDVPLPDKEPPAADSSKPLQEEIPDNETTSLTKKIQNYYTRILLFAFITKDYVSSLSDIVHIINNGDNVRIADNLGLDEEVLSIFSTKYNPWALSKLDYKIQDLSGLSHANEVDPIKRAEIALHKFGKLGDAIVVTPPNICDDMVALLPDNFLLDVAKSNGRILDIAGTAGEFAAALYKRFISLGVEQHTIANLIYTIPKSSICYELTRKMYEMLGLNAKNIAIHFNAFNLLTITKGKAVDYERIKSLLQQHKPFKDITLTDTPVEGDNMCIFNAVVGNPPYQSTAPGTSTSDLPIYHYFADMASVLAQKNILIMPARFLFNAGKTPKDWNKRMLEDTHIRVAMYETNTKNIFPDTEIPGGMSIIYRDNQTSFEPIGQFVPFEMLSQINTKIKSKNETSLMELIYSQNKFNLEALYLDYPELKNQLGSNGKDKRFRQIIMERYPNIFTTNKTNTNDIRVLGLINHKRAYRFIKRKYVEQESWLNAYKVFIPFSNGASGTLGDKPARLISKPVIGLPNDGITQTFIGMGEFSTKEEAENLLKYIQSKFARVLLGILKVTQGNKSDTWAEVPLQNFSSASDIVWTKSISAIDKSACEKYGCETINEIDAQLYDKYNLLPEEVQFIESMIQPME